MTKQWKLLILTAIGMGCMGVIAQDPAVAEVAAEAADAAAKANPEPTESQLNFLTANNVWMLLCTFMVFMMHLGFASLESGLTRAKNTVNILFKNTGIISIGILTYAAWGFNLMYPGFAEGIAEGSSKFSEFFKFAGPGILNSVESNADAYAYVGGAYGTHTDFLFQAMFAATAATIVSGAVAGRIKLGSFFIFSILYVGIVYPIFGSWTWGYGWLENVGFKDFAGSTIVHSVGGWAALAGVIVLGPRLGKYVGGKVKAIPGHSLPLAAIGVFLLWFGWFGFNGGSVLSADPAAISFVCVTTALAGAAGIAGAIGTSWIFQRHPDLSMALNGALAGLVGITAGADVIAPLWAVVIGLIAGILVVFSVLFFDRLKIDDPVGAISVHLVCGIWGTLAVGIFAPGFGLGPQIIGILAAAALCFPSALLLFYILKLTLGLRVSEDEELMGLDIGEHGMEAYGGFQIWSTQ